MCLSLWQAQSRCANPWAAQLLRAIAEMENMRKRNAVEVEQASKYAIKSFAADLLDVADNLGRALELIPDEARSGEQGESMKALYEGVSMTDQLLLKVFGKHGVQRIDPVNEKFDPHFHEAVYEMPVPDMEPGHVAKVESVGYKLQERCLRPAKVGVVKKT